MLAALKVESLQAVLGTSVFHTRTIAVAAETASFYHLHKLLQMSLQKGLQAQLFSAGC